MKWKMNYEFRVHKYVLTHWGRVTHICVGNLTIIVSDNGLSPYRRQAIIWTNAGLLLIGPLGTNFSEILIKILTFSFKKMRLKVSSAKRRPFCLGLNVLILPTPRNYLNINNQVNIHRELTRGNFIFIDVHSMINSLSITCGMFRLLSTRKPYVSYIVSH